MGDLQSTLFFGNRGSSSFISIVDLIVLCGSVVPEAVA